MVPLAGVAVLSGVAVLLVVCPASLEALAEALRRGALKIGVAVKLVEQREVSFDSRLELLSKCAKQFVVTRNAIGVRAAHLCAVVVHGHGGALV